jgi:hypothetical protein
MKNSTLWCARSPGRTGAEVDFEVTEDLPGLYPSDSYPSDSATNGMQTVRHSPKHGGATTRQRDRSSGREIQVRHSVHACPRQPSRVMRRGERGRFSGGCRRRRLSDDRRRCRPWRGEAGRRVLAEPFDVGAWASSVTVGTPILKALNKGGFPRGFIRTLRTLHNY